MNKLQVSVLALAVTSALNAQAEEISSASKSEQESAPAKYEVIVISGSRMEQEIQQVAGSILVIDEAAIEKSMSNDFGSLFRNESAVGVKGGAGKPTTVTIRGIGGNRVMMVKDGVRVNNQYASPLGPGAEGTGRGLTEVQSLKQVEVVKAAASTMYGSDALGGVVVMRTKDASDYLMGDDTYLSVNSGYSGINNEYSAGFTAANSVGNFENLLTYQRRVGEETQNYQQDLPDSDLVQDSILLKSKYHFNDHTSLQLSVDYLEQKLERWEPMFDDTSALTERVDTRRDTQVLNGALQLRSDKPSSLHDSLTVVMYYGATKQNEDRDYYSFDGNNQSTNDRAREYIFEDERLGINSTFNKYIGEDSYGHNITYGMDLELSSMLRHRTYAEQDSGEWQVSHPFTFADTDSQRIGVFAQDDIKLLDGKLNLIAGIRFDNFENTPDKSTLTSEQDPENFDEMSESFWSPKLGLIYHITDDVSVYGQYTYGYKMPTPDQKWGELVINEPGMPMEVLLKPNYDLESEQSNTFEAGVRGSHSDTSYELTLFYSQVKDYIDWQFLGMDVFPQMNLQYGYFNREEVKLYGFEAQVNQWIGDSLELWGNLSYTHGEDENGDYLNSVSPMRGTVGANYYTELAGMEADVATVVRFADKMDRTTDLDIFPGMDTFNSVYNTPGYAVVDLTLGLRINDSWKLRTGVYNLFDKEYIDYADVAGQSKYLLNSLGTPDTNFTQPGRYFNVSVNYQF
ncbi:TonB-dependent hemoglobin/transferrin/lactoferrin family receptor [Shewanella canadensis]|uniref:TonB-dependent hemoglobin/transferrin/lactoferrin family receptor n=1 Tax=Shewanella canadensis TaxID=271096 RepID=A0A431WX49_9GAMM|nr:TonB-dependent hemoglobin/transferrin/lactoferrin family receptor [Shewanella canadensis]RTR39975.1 TonB-dependent hemoglobin/transferrin/lactoferrin family receptor [Shewanella canadensis]